MVAPMSQDLLKGTLINPKADRNKCPLFPLKSSRRLGIVMASETKKPCNAKHSLAATSNQQQPGATTSRSTQVPPAPTPKHLRIELPTPKPIYTTHSSVTGIVHVYEKDPKYIKKIKVSIVCSVRSRCSNSRESSDEDGLETTKLFNLERILWTRRSVDEMPPSSFPFEIRIPETGTDPEDGGNNTSLPPSFFANTTSGLFIGFVKYYAKARIIRRGCFRFNRSVSEPFHFLPPSGPPNLLPPPPETICLYNLGQMTSLWTDSVVSKRISKADCEGMAVLSLWLPRVDKLPPATSIPFFLCLRLHTYRLRSQKQKPDLLSSRIQLDKASVYLRQKVLVRAEKAIQTYKITHGNNFVRSVVPQESDWKRISSSSGEPYWNKEYIWEGHWEFHETPSFTNRQLTLKYFIVAEVPIKGWGNDIAVVSQELEVSTGMLAGQNPVSARSASLPEYSR